jgi:hypothetical protein
LDETERRAEFLAALNNHYFVLQSAAGNTITESAARASLYMVSVSISLVAIAFVAQSRSAFSPFLAVVLPALFVLGLFTVVRLVDTGVQNFVYLRSMTEIRRYYAGLGPDAPRFFGDAPGNPYARLGRPSRLGAARQLFTIGSMIALINSLIGGAGAVLVAARLGDGFDRAPVPSLVAGLVVGLALFASFLVYQHRRYGSLSDGATAEPPA